MLEVEPVESADLSQTGDNAARERLFSLLYDQLHRLAEREIRQHSFATLSPTTLLHETYLNIRTRDSAADRQQFLSYAARAMRGLIIDYVRSRQAQKRGGRHQIVPLSEESDAVIQEIAGCEHLGDALTQLATMNARLAECVDLKFFCGFSFRDIALLWGVSERTVQRDWEKARALLHRLIREMSAPLRAPG
jgi:RNA polymerase sigma factor (TIGR02999 family)